MRDISAKIKTLRTATAEATLKASPDTINLLRKGEIPKGDPLPVAKVAAIQAAKNASQIIPYCHPLPIDFVGVDFDIKDDRIIASVTVKAIYKTGVEMEALSAAAVAALTLYDMMKMLDEEMEIAGVKLLSKLGGKSDFKKGHGMPLRAAVLIMSDSIVAGHKEDLSGRAIMERLESEGMQICSYKIISDDLDTIVETLVDCADDMKVDLIMTTGGTGLSPRDSTPEAIRRVIEREVPGIAEYARSYGQERMPYSMLSRSVAGLRGKTLIVSLPGSLKGVTDSLDALLPALLHSFHVLAGGDHQISVTKS